MQKLLPGVEKRDHPAGCGEGSEAVQDGTGEILLANGQTMTGGAPPLARLLEKLET